jgi:hypothetical protein
MKNILLFTMQTVAFFSFSQKVERPKRLKPYEDSINKVFESVLKTDHYYTTKRLIPDAVRDKMYEANLNVICYYIDKGFLKKDSCEVYSQKLYSSIIQGTGLTFLHILKYCPELILNDKFIEYLHNVLESNLLDKRLFLFSLEFFHSLISWEKYNSGEIPQFIKLCNHNHQYDDLFYETIKRWGIDKETLRHDVIRSIGK